MCTLITVNQDFYLEHRKSLTARIVSDAKYNNDGWSLICVDPLSLNLDMHLVVMGVVPIVNAIDTFMAACSPYGRIFLHARAATTDFVGVAFNHGFTDARGTMIQHNGVIHNYRNLAVDSFNLSDYRTSSAHEMLEDLETAVEFWANIFLVRPTDNSYGVVRMQGGTLYRDDDGNYSTNPVGTINKMVGVAFAREHNIMPVMKNTVSTTTSTSVTKYDSALNKIVEDAYGPTDDFSEYWAKKEQDDADADLAWDAIKAKVQAG